MLVNLIWRTGHQLTDACDTLNIIFNVRLCIEIQWHSVPDVLYVSFFKSNNAILPNASSSNHNRFYLEKTWRLIGGLTL